MKKTILLIGLLLLMPLAFAETQVSVNVNSNENIVGYFDLNSPNNNIYINGVNYKGYVDYKIESQDSAKTDVVNMFDKVTLFMINPKGQLATDYNSLAFSLARLLDYVTNNIYQNLILPMQIKQNAIIKTLDSEVYCNNLAEEYFKAFGVNEFRCQENGKTYYDDVDLSIKVVGQLIFVADGNLSTNNNS